MKPNDITIGEQYRHCTPNGPVVIVYAIHEDIDNYYYIKFVEDNRADTTQRELLFPMEPKKIKWTNHRATWERYPINQDDKD